MRLRTALAAFGLCLFSGAAYAETSAWMTGGEFETYINSAIRKGLIPTKISCAKGADHNVKGAAIRVRVNTEPNSKRIQWGIAWGDLSYYNKQKKKYEGAGFKRVSHSSFSYGVTVQCTLWHKI
jgi:hypothetical protein